MEQRIRLAPNVDSAREARRFVDRVLGGWDGDERRDDVVLLANELVVNAIRHAHTSIEIRVALDPQAVEVAVRDEGPGWPQARTPRPDAESGRGLFTVDALADEWGVHDEVNGKAVWFRLAARARHTATR